MSKPTILSGKFSAGSFFECGENVIIDVAEECVVGDRVVLADNTHIEGRRVTIGSDFYGYRWEWKRLDIGRGRRDEESAILTVGSRCTFHDNKIDLCREVNIGDDVGLSPEVCLYNHGYWGSPLEGFPCKYSPIHILNNVIIGYRTVILPGAFIYEDVVVGANSVVTNTLLQKSVYAGNPARKIRDIFPPSESERKSIVGKILEDYARSCTYRGIPFRYNCNWFTVEYRDCRFDLEHRTVEGEEDDHTDDFRWFLFTRGIRMYTLRPFKKLPIQR